MKALWLMAGLLALAISTPIAAQTSPSPAGTYVLFQGTIGNTTATMLLDSVNGKTWFLGQVDEAGRISVALPFGQGGTATWIPLPFAPKAPPSPPR